MKIANRILLILTLIIHSYFPICMIIAKYTESEMRPTLAPVAAIITLALTLAATVFAFLYSAPDLLCKVLSLITAAVSAANFAFYFIYTDSAAAIIMIIACYVSAAVLAVKTNKSVFTRILLPIALGALGLVTFVISLIFAVVIGLATPSVQSAFDSPDGSFRAELQKKTGNSYEVRLYESDGDLSLPFLKLLPEGERVWSGKWEEGSEISWLDADTILIDGNTVEIGQFFQ